MPLSKIVQSSVDTPVAGTGPAFSAYCSSNQSITNSTWTKIQINTEIFDTASAFDNTTNYRFTPQVAGYYQVNGSVYNGNNGGSGLQAISIYKNGSFNINLFGTYPNGGAIQVSNLIYFNGSTDYIELYYNQSSGSTQIITGGAPYTLFSASMVKAA